MSLRRCPDCGLNKPHEEFARNSARPDGLAFYCRVCFNRRSAESYRRRREAGGHAVREKVTVPDGHKFCPSCRQVLPLEDFHRAARQSGGRASYCKPCKRTRDDARRLQRLYGLDAQALARLSEAQGGLCLLCRVRPWQHIDHDHVSRAVRGLLCFPCNVGLGQFGDRADVLRRAASYVERHSAGRTRVAAGVCRAVQPVPPRGDLAPLLAARALARR